MVISVDRGALSLPVEDLSNPALSVKTDSKVGLVNRIAVRTNNTNLDWTWNTYWVGMQLLYHLFPFAMVAIHKIRMYLKIQELCLPIALLVHAELNSSHLLQFTVIDSKLPSSCLKF